MQNRDWLRKALANKGIAQAELARRLSAHMKKKIHPTVINKMLSGERDIRFDEIVSLAILLDTQPPVPRTKYSVPVVGVVSAGATATLYATGHEMFEEIDAPPDASRSTVAVRVVGDSMYGIADDGSYIYYDAQPGPPTDDMIGKLCVVCLSDQRVLVKRLRRGSEAGRYTLQSVNAPDMENVLVEWATRVTWIKPG